MKKMIRILLLPTIFSLFTSPAILTAMNSGQKAVNTNSRTPIQRAVITGNIKLVARLLQQGATLNDTTPNGEKLIHLAALAGNIAMVNFLLQKGATINDITTTGSKKPIHFAAQGKHIKLVKWLLSHGATVNDAGTDDKKPIHYAAFVGGIKMVKWLLSHSASINATCSDGEKPIHFAASSGQFEMLKFLLQNGATIHDTDDEGLKPIHYVTKTGNIEIFKFLFNNGATTNDGDSSGRKPIHTASEYGQIEMVKWLLEHGATIHDTDLHGAKPIHYAAASGQLEILKFLLQNGATINDTNTHGWKPLCFAVAHGKMAAIRLLTEEFGAIIDQTVLDAIKEIEDPKTKDILAEFLTLMSEYYNADNNIFYSFLTRQLTQDESKKGAETDAFKILIKWASSRNQFFINRLYDAINFLFTENERKNFGFYYTGIKDLYIDTIKHTPHSLPAKKLLLSLLGLCKTNIFRSPIETFENSVNNMIQSKLDTDDREEVIKQYKKNYLFDANLNALVGSKFVDVKILTYGKKPN